MASERDTEEHKYGKDVAAVSSIPAMQPSESNRIAIIISPRATTASKIMPLELISHGSDPQASHATHHHHHQWHPSFPNVAAVPLIKKVMAEFLSTFILIFIVLCTIIMSGQHDVVEGLLGIAVFAGLAATVLVLSIINISGCHLNPAVSIVMAVFGHLPLGHVFPYITVQVLGSIAASFGPKAISHPVNAGIVTVPRVGTVQMFFVEFIMTFVLFVITGGGIRPVTA